MRTFSVFVLGFIVLFFGCSTTSQVGSDYDPVVRFPELRTFSWHPPAADGRVNEIIENRVKADVVDQLSAKGYEEVTSDPDFMVTYWAQVTSPRSSNVSMGMGMSFGRSSNGSRSRRSSISISSNTANVSQMREGTLVLNFLDGNTLISFTFPPPDLSPSTGA